MQVLSGDDSLAGLLAMTIAALLVFGLRTAAIAVELILLAAVAALVFGGFCLGSYIFHLLRRSQPRTVQPRE